MFPDKDLAVGDVNIIPALSVAYYPTEKGPYNFTTDVDRDGKLRNPEKRWGGMMRSITTSDFETANVQYIETWLMDPFVYDNRHKGGDVYFDLGNVSEDILKDGRKAFENGLPAGPDIRHVDTTRWGRVPGVQSITNGFDNNSQARRYQDVGLDGMNDEDERIFYALIWRPCAGLSEKIRKYTGRPGTIRPGDNYHFFRGSDYDALETPVLERYKQYNGTEGNSPTADMSPESYPTAATTLPDVEDINGDNTLNETEAFFRYHLELRPEKMKVGENFITNITTSSVELPNGSTEEIKWYQIKIPLSAHESDYGKISRCGDDQFCR